MFYLTYLNLVTLDTIPLKKIFNAAQNINPPQKFKYLHYMMALYIFFLA